MTPAPTDTSTKWPQSMDGSVASPTVTAPVQAAAARRDQSCLHQVHPDPAMAPLLLVGRCPGPGLSMTAVPVLPSLRTQSLLIHLEPTVDSATRSLSKGLTTFIWPRLPRSLDSMLRTLSTIYPSLGSTLLRFVSFFKLLLI